MKKIISILLVLTLACGMFVACTNDETKDETTTTAAKATTKPRDDTPPTNQSPIRDDIELVADKTMTYKYKAVEVVWQPSSPEDFAIRTTDGFGEFVAQNPDWFAKDFNDADWDEAVGPLGDRINNLGDGNSEYWPGSYHGLFVRTTFELTKEQLDILKNTEDEAILSLYIFYDNALNLYLNGTKVLSHDSGSLQAEGVDARSLPNDWTDGYVDMWLDSTNEYYVYDGNAVDLLVEGTNVIAASLLDCWGGREFDMGIWIVYPLG